HHYSDNTFSIIRPNTYHNEIHHEETDLFCIGFSHARGDFAPVENGVYPDHYCALQKIVKEMKHELLAKKQHYTIKLNLLLSEYLIEFDRMRSVASVSDSLQYILNYIHENFNLDIEIPALARLSGYSYDHFRHMFKARTGL